MTTLRFIEFGQSRPAVRPAPASLSARLLMTVSMHGHSDKNNLQRLKYATEAKSRSWLLCSTDASGCLQLNFEGIVPLARIDLGKVEVLATFIEGQALKVVTQEERASRCSVSILSFDFQQVEFLQEEMIAVFSILFYVNELMDFLSHSMKAVEKAVTELSKKYFFKMSILDSLLETAGRDPTESNL